MEEKKSQIEQKIKNKKNNIENILKQNEKDNIKNIKLNQEKYETVLNEHKNLMKLDEQKRAEMALLLQKKSDKIDEFIKNKNNENQKSAMKKEIISNNRREFELEFKSLFHDKKIDDNLINKITEYFPNNNNLINIVEKIKVFEDEEYKSKMKKRAKSSNIYIKLNEKNKNVQYKFNNRINQYNQNIKINNDINIKKNNNMYNNMNKENIFINTINQNFDNKFNNQMNNINNKEQENKEILIKGALNEYKIKLNKELLNIIEQEENKEKERIKLFNNTSINKKDDIMEELKEERKKSNDLIKNIIENNENKLKEYELQLIEKYK